MNSTIETDPVDPAPIVTREDESRLAHFISNLFSPLTIALLTVLLVVSQTKEPLAWFWALVALVMPIGIPSLYIIWKVRTGEITDFHVKVRSQRTKPMLVSLASIILTLTVMILGDAPRLFTVMVALCLPAGIANLLITLRWKISSHCTAITVFSILLVNFFGPALLPALLCIPLVAWARVRIQRHTFWQTVGGALLGLGYVTMVLILI